MNEKSQSSRIAVDAMGGDNAPRAVIEGVLAALSEKEGLRVTLIGDPGSIEQCIAGQTHERLDILPSTQVIEMAEPPVEAIRKKKDSSMVKGLEMVAHGEADVFVTAGSTGAALAGATLVVRRVKGVLRPALAPVLPSEKATGVLLIDCGASVDCKSSYLRQYGIMGSIYMEQAMGVKNPRVGLINNGAEEEKGCALTKEAFGLLSEAPINFVGNAEGRDVFSGDFDVLVCDGFVGNVMMKVLEGTAGFLMGMIKDELMSTKRSKVGAMLSKQAFQSVKKRMDYTEYGGALMLGINGGVIKAHGSSNAKAIRSAVLQAHSFACADIAGKIRDAISDMQQ